MEHYDFDKKTSRNETYSAKWSALLGDDVIPLSVADMDIPLPVNMIERLNTFNHKGIYGYTLLSQDWNDTVSQWFSKHHHWDIPTEHIVFCPRVIQAISIYIQSFTEYSDTILTLSPAYHPINDAVRLNHRQLLESELIYEDGCYHIDFDDLESKFKLAKCFIFLSPHNPTGIVWEEEKLIKIAKLAERYNVFIISDDVHCDFIFNNSQHRFISTLSHYVEQNSLICTSPAKTLNMAGLEVANIIIANNKIREEFKNCLAAAGIHNPGYFSVPAFLTAYKECDDWLLSLKTYLAENRSYAATLLQKYFPTWKITQSSGTYMLWVNYQSSGISEEQLKHWFISLAKVEMSWGSDFGHAGEGFFRINIATQRATLVAALERIVSTFPYAPQE